MMWEMFSWRSVGKALATLGVSCLIAASPAHAQAGNGLPDFSELVEKAGPSVVNIRTTEKVQRGGMPQGLDEDMAELFRRFGLPMPGLPRGQGPRGGVPREDSHPRGVGSGFIISQDGYVLTNAHVVDGADEVIVTLTDKREFKSRIIGSDKRTDVALVKIEATGLPAIRTGDSSRLKVGEWVIAIGSPFGLDSTVTAGIVSAKARDTGELLPFIQTDVAINPGNSGGPLINMRGEVVGINSQIYSRSGGYMGISFAIPIDEALRVSDQLRQSGRVSRGRIGVTIGPVGKELAEALGLGKATGAQIQGVEAGSPADKAGLKEGDVVTKVDSQTVSKVGDLSRLIAAVKPGQKATLQVFRRGSYKDVVVTVAEMERDTVEARAGTPDGAPGGGTLARAAFLGLTVEDLSESQKRDAQVKAGVRVKAVEGSAQRAGIQVGDILLVLGQSEITGVKAFEAAVLKLDRQRPVAVQIRRGQWSNLLVLRPGNER